MKTTMKSMKVAKAKTAMKGRVMKKKGGEQDCMRQVGKGGGL